VCRSGAGEAPHELGLARQATAGVVFSGRNFLLQHLKNLLVFGHV